MLNALGKVMTIVSNEPRPEAIIDDLHKIPEDLLAESGNDLRAYVEAARKRQRASDRPVVSRPGSSKGVLEPAGGDERLSS